MKPFFIGEKMTPIFSDHSMTNQWMPPASERKLPSFRELCDTIFHTLPSMKGLSSSSLDNDHLMSMVRFIEACPVCRKRPNPDEININKKKRQCLTPVNKIESVVENRIDDRKFQEYALEAIHLNPKASDSYMSLALSLPKNGKISLLDGTEMNQQELLLKVIHLAPTNMAAYLHLARLVPKSGVVRLFDGRELSQEDLYLIAIELDPTNPLSYVFLGYILPKKRTVRLLNGVLMDRQLLFLKTIDLNPKCGQAYLFLSKTLRGDEGIYLFNGRYMDRIDLLLKSIELQTDFS